MSKDFDFWKNNAEEDYLKVPISVLKYISKLEKQQERMYSEEDMLLFAKFVYTDDGSCVDNDGNVKKETLEQFKKNYDQ